MPYYFPPHMYNAYCVHKQRYDEKYKLLNDEREQEMDNLMYGSGYLTALSHCVEVAPTPKLAMDLVDSCISAVNEFGNSLFINGIIDACCAESYTIAYKGDAPITFSISYNKGPKGYRAYADAIIDDVIMRSYGNGFHKAKASRKAN